MEHMATELEEHVTAEQLADEVEQMATELEEAVTAE